MKFIKNAMRGVLGWLLEDSLPNLAAAMITEQGIREMRVAQKKAREGKHYIRIFKFEDGALIKKKGNSLSIRKFTDDYVQSLRTRSKLVEVEEIMEP